MLADPEKPIFEGGENPKIAAGFDAITTPGASRGIQTTFASLATELRTRTGQERQTVAFGLVGEFKGAKGEEGLGRQAALRA